MQYELMLVATVNNGDSLLTRVEKAIREKEVRDIKVDNLGKKTLAYPIKKNTDAHYFVLNFAAEAESIKPISDMLKLEQEELLRYMIVKRREKDLRIRPKKVSGEEKGEKAKPKVTVAVKQSSRVKSTSSARKGAKSSKAKITKVKSKK